MTRKNTLTHHTHSGCLLVFLFCLTFPFFTASAQTTTATTTLEDVRADEAVDNHPYETDMLRDDGRIQGDFVVGPGKIEVSLAPGDTKTVDLLVTNRTGETKVFSVEFEDMTGGRTADQAVVLLGNDRGPYTLKDYLSVPQPDFTLDHMERVRVPVTITIPADAEPGGRYGSVLFSITSRSAFADAQTETKPASAIVSRIGTLFFVTTEGDIEREGSLVGFSTRNDKFWFSRGPIPMRMAYENTGSQHLNPYGYISIRNLFGEEVGYVEIDPWFVLPRAIRARDIDFPREFLLGYYTAELHLNRGYDNEIDTQTLSFVVVPWRVLALFFGGFIILFLFLRLLFSRFEIKRK